MNRPGAQGGGVAVGSVLGDTYEIVRLIGQGGMGAVWEARHLRLPGKRVAVKVLLANIDPQSEAWARFRREAEIASRLGHTNIVEVHDFNVTTDGAPYLVLELLQGESLAARLARGKLAPTEVVAVTRQIGSALAAAHREGVIHRDLKPENVFLCPGDDDGPPRVKVLDFGISKIAGSSTVQTQEQRILGTPQYMAPEQAKGQNSAIDARTDVFALGVIAYEMLAGQAPFQGANLAEVVFKVVYEQPAALAPLAPEAPATMIAAIDKALAKEPDARHADVAAFVAALSGRPIATLDRPAPAGGAAAPAKRGDAAALAETQASGDRAAPADGAAKAAKRGDDAALAATRASSDGAVAMANTVASEDHPAAEASRAAAPPEPTPGEPGRPGRPVPAPLPRAATPVPPPAPPTADVRRRSRAGLIAAGLFVAVGAAAVGLVVVRGGSSHGDGEPSARSEATPGSTSGGIADAAAATTAEASTASADEPVQRPDATLQVSMSAAPDAGTAGAKPATKPPPAPPAPPPPPPADKPGPPAKAGDDDEGQAKPYLVDAEAAYEAGNYKEAVRLAQRSLGERSTSRAYAIMARAYCQLGDLSNAKAQLSHVSPRHRPRVKKVCSDAGIDLGR